MKVLGEGCDSATAREMIADKCNALELAHCMVSMSADRSSVAAIAPR